MRVIDRGSRLFPLLMASLCAGLALGCSNESSSGGDAGAPAANRPASAPAAKSPTAPAGSGDAQRAAAPSVDSTRSQAELVAAGRSIYNANCIACHAIDPTVDGALGPAVAGSSYELLEARIVRGEYPEGYQPKRPSRVMVALPHLESKLPELTAYLNSL